MKILFVIDRLELKYFELNKLVTNFWLIDEFLSRGLEVFITTIDKLSVSGGVAYSSCYESYRKDDNIFYKNDSETLYKIEDFQLVMFRPDPPVDLDYINATYVFDFVDRSKTFIVNDTTSIRNFNEKFHAVLFKNLMPDNIVTAGSRQLFDFLDKNSEIILKPLNQCFGGGVMYLRQGDKNTAVIINQMTQNGTKMVMAQKYIETAVYGDKRVMFLGEDIVPYCVQKVPSNNDFKFCEHSDATVQKAVLSDLEIEKFKPVAKELNSMGIYMAGLDVIDEQIIEVNVTSPCYFIKEINNYFGCQLQKDIVDFILAKIPSSLVK